MGFNLRDFVRANGREAAIIGEELNSTFELNQPFPPLLQTYRAAIIGEELNSTFALNQPFPPLLQTYRAAIIGEELNSTFALNQPFPPLLQTYRAAIIGEELNSTFALNQPLLCWWLVGFVVTRHCYVLCRRLGLWVSVRDSAGSNPVYDRCNFYQYHHLVLYRHSPLFCLIRSSHRPAFIFPQQLQIKRLSVTALRQHGLNTSSASGDLLIDLSVTRGDFQLPQLL
ncbi:hypothetical protein J6590_056334 [Homalodisca vitripennis]|nr:hypothetical protein J6590_056334 [Homalodisca vitripennis]